MPLKKASKTCPGDDLVRAHRKPRHGRVKCDVQRASGRLSVSAPVAGVFVEKHHVRLAHVGIGADDVASPPQSRTKCWRPNPLLRTSFR
jgi:hypothetical protein